MTQRKIKSALRSVEYGEQFDVKLKTGDTVVCKCDPDKEQVEAAFQQTLSKETVYRGDIFRPKEIAAF